ncbi:hypothetical protein SLEP1_g13643 [Rubroshorea leprosula]|uniref:Reverse transcriptase domain-containing protein n=1 Tax=Rubroshorea leprosula TaxID=152421 RepID=A0AAV5IL29_9ROSI|nr:hypothetical protein SLEP1_g13643 [Rubroshorea leprosula]
MQPNGQYKKRIMGMEVMMGKKFVQLGSLQRSNARGLERTVGQEREGNRKPTYGYGKGVLEQATSFFITKFPKDVEMGDMWQAFVKCGRAIQIFIAQKRDRWGRRFGFTRFLDVANPNSLEAKLNQIKFEALKGGKSKTHGQAQRKEWQRKRQGISDKSQMESWHGLEVKVEEEDMEWLRNSFVGFAKSPEIICNLQEKFLMEGYFSAKVTPMGSNMVLITCEDSEELKNLVETGRDWPAQWFTDTKPWNPELVAAERFTWLRCQGVPLHIWKSSFFETVANLFGKFISLDNSTIKKSRLDVAKILVMTPSQANIQRVIKVKARESTFQIRISEESGIDNLFSLHSDFVLCRNEESEDEEWSDESNWGETENEHNWDGWQIMQDDEDREIMEEVDSGRKRWGVSPEPELESEVEKVSETKLSEKVPETTLPKKVAFNADGCNSNLLAVASKEGSSEEDHGVDLLENGKSNAKDGNEEIGSDSLHKGKEGDRNVYQQNVNQLGLMDQNTSQLRLDSNSVGEGMGSQQGVKILKRTITQANEKSEDSKEVGDLEDGRRKVGEEEKSTQPFWEGLASDDEILQARAECLARDRARKGKWVKQMKGRRKRKNRASIGEDNLKSIHQMAGIEGECSSSNCKNESSKKWKQEAAEFWEIGLRLGLIYKGNVEDLIRRVGEMEKRDRIALETKLEVFDDKIAKSIWGDEHCAWVAKDARGRSGGIACVWNLDSFNMVRRIEGSGFIGMFGFWGNDAVPCFLINVYSSYDKQEKRIFWGELLDLIKANRGGNWCVGGDFNAVRDQDERSGRYIDATDMRGFNDFILGAGLEEIPMLKAWNKEVFGGVDRNIDAAREEIKRLDEKEENGGLTSMEIGKRKENFQKLMEWSLYSNGEWIEDVGEVKELARNYFKGKFEEEKWSRPTLGDLQFKKISEADNKFLISKFSSEEIDEAVWGCNGTKSPGPDGFNFNFIKKVWPVIKEDVYAFLAEFHENGKLVKGSNASFLVLIPKKDNPQSLGDYRPISLISSMYKIVSKILANRLSKVLDLVISPNQTAFIGGRHITDGIIITNEIIHEAKQSKKPMLVFKEDFEKAYDSINWEIPTKDNLMKRGMNDQGNEKCVLCDLEAESVEHLFFKCNVSWSIWASCYDWWDLKVASHSKGWPHLEQHTGMISTGMHYAQTLCKTNGVQNQQKATRECSNEFEIIEHSMDITEEGLMTVEI